MLFFQDPDLIEAFDSLFDSLSTLNGDKLPIQLPPVTYNFSLVAIAVKRVTKGDFSVSAGEVLSSIGVQSPPELDLSSGEGETVIVSVIIISNFECKSRERLPIVLQSFVFSQFS